MVSPRKTQSALGLIPEECCRMAPSTTMSCESLYSAASSKGSAYASRRSSTAGLKKRPGALRQAAFIPATTEVRQRVLSARRLRIKNFQSQLSEAHQTISELSHENRMLRTLHKRQDNALAKYESTNAELPQLLHAHSEELRMWQTKCRTVQAAMRDLEVKLKQKEAIILSLNDQNKYYSQLNKDKGLDERQRLAEKLTTMELRLQEKDNDMKMLARKMQLEIKNLKQQLLTEQRKGKDMMLKLEQSRLELSGYRKLDELNLSSKFSNISLRGPRKLGDKVKLGKDLKGKDKLDLSETDLGEPDSQSSHRSSLSILANALDPKPTPPIRKIGLPPTKLNSKLLLKEELPPRSRLDRAEGDGDTSHMPPKKPMPTKKPPIKAAVKAEPPKKPPTVEYEDEFENSEEEDEEDEEPSLTAVAKGSLRSKLAPIEFINRSEEDEDEEDEDGFSPVKIAGVNDEDEDDDEEDEEDSDILASTKQTSQRMKKDISSIRKQISDDYKEREAFLDTFCRQATTGVGQDDAVPKKRNSLVLGQNPQNNRKSKLLAALKAIEDN